MPAPSESDKLRTLVKSMNMTYDRAKIFKIMNKQMYDNDRFQLESKI